MRFSQRQRGLAIRAVGEAEARTTRYYCIPPYRWHELHYDFLTRQDREWEPLPEGALARVRFWQRATRRPNDLSAFYRIELNDETILSAAARERLESNLYPFLVYIVTHEMVHLVRLSTILVGHEALPGFDESEERRVQSISRRILAGPSEFQPVLDKFCSSPVC